MTAPTEAPALVAAEPSDSAVDLTWTLVEGADHYLIHYLCATGFGEGGFGEGAFGGGLFGGAETPPDCDVTLTVYAAGFYRVSELVNGVAYTFTVTAASEDDEAGPDSNPLTAVPVAALVAPTQPEAPAVRTVAGQVQQLYLIDVDTIGKPVPTILEICPGKDRGGIFLRDLEITSPEVRPVVSNAPDRDGTLDFTRNTAARAVNLTVVCGPRADGQGGMSPDAIPDALGRYSGAAWTDRLAGWAVLGRRVAMVVRLRGLPARLVYLRAEQLSAPIIGSGTDRSWQRVQVSWRVPDGGVWALPTTGADPEHFDRQCVSVVRSGTKPKVNFFAPLVFFERRVTFFGGTTSGSIPYTGGRPSWPIVRVSARHDAAVTDPVFTIGDGTTVRATLGFDGLSIAAGQTLIVDMAEGTAYVDDGVQLIDVNRYLTAPAPWQGWYLAPGGSDKNKVNFTGGSTAGIDAAVCWRTATA